MNITIDEYLDNLEEELKKFKREIQNYQCFSPSEGGLPEKMTAGEWDDQFMAFYMGVV